ncbi:hypothetical protein IAT38_004451 [Cryptococcus sp. DSM 104549]
MSMHPALTTATACDLSPPSTDNITLATFRPLFEVWNYIFQELKLANPSLISRVSKSLHEELNPLIYKRIVLDRSLPLPGVFRIHTDRPLKDSYYRTLHLVESLSVLNLLSVQRLTHTIASYRRLPAYTQRNEPLFPNLRHLHFGNEVILACASEQTLADAASTPEGMACMTLGRRLGMALEGMMSPQELCLDAMRYRDTDADYDTYDLVVDHIVSGINHLERVTWHIPSSDGYISWGFTHMVQGAKEMRWEVAETGREDTMDIIYVVTSLVEMAWEDFINHQDDESWPEGVKRVYVVPYRDDLEKVWKDWRKSKMGPGVERGDDDDELWELISTRKRGEVCECRRKK